MLEFLKATICFNLPPVRRCSRNDVCKCDKFSSLHNWWSTRGDSARPASSTGLSERGSTLFQKDFISTYYISNKKKLILKRKKEPADPVKIIKIMQGVSDINKKGASELFMGSPNMLCLGSHNL